MSAGSKRPPENPGAALDFETFFDVSLDMLCVRDREGRFVKVNQAWTTSLGYATAELEGSYLLPLIHPDDLGATLVEMKRVRSEGQGLSGFVNRYRHRDGSYRHLEWHARQVGDLVFAVARDVTNRFANERERLRLAKKLEAKSARLAAVQTVAKIGSWEIDFQTGETTWSDEMHRIFDTDPKAPPPPYTAVLDIMHPEDRERAAAAFSLTRETPSDLVLRYRLLLPDGRTRHVEERWQSGADGAGPPVRARGTCQDITELHEMQEASRRRLERALSETEAILDNSYDVICTVDGAGRFVRVNRRAEQLWGYAAAELAGAPSINVVHPEDRASTAAVVARVMAGSPAGGHMTRCLCKDGSVLPMMWSMTWSEAHRTMFAVARDMREHLSAEARLRQSQKMAAVGRLTGGVAHDFNNLLTVIIGSVDELAAALSDKAELEALARVSLDAAERGAELIRRLLAYARNQPLASEAVDCNRMLKTVEDLIRSTFTEEVAVVVEPAAEPLFCLADATQLTTALLNLCINARDAMPDGGRLRLCVARVTEEPGGQPRSDGAASSFAVFRVEDSGQGMSAETMAQAAEPFFTTKAAGEGSGLGLSMVHGFVEQSGGRLEIDSERGAGTRVSIWLPQTQPDEKALPAAGETPGAPAATERGRILLVEDDPLIRSQVERQLRAMGHVVVAAGDGPEALVILGRSAKFDLLLTDVAMPNGLNGHELAKRATALNPQIRILLSSGHSEDAVLQGAERRRGVAFLPKPYRRAALEQKIAQLLQRGPASAEP
jgi:PAS domain S-box-containing protein